MRRHTLATALAVILPLGTALATDAPAVRFDAATISGLGARNIGSARMSGRIAALDAVEVDGKITLYVGAASGGVWKSSDGGTTFKPVFDKQPVQSIGAVAIDRANPRTVWVGTGESWTRNSVSIGNGIYKSNDGGDTWQHMGLPESERITKILVHPKDSNTVYACVPGKLWSDSTERGLYQTRDGGKTWSLLLKGPNASTGCGDVSMDASDPNRLFASLWDFRRKGWTFRSGGEGPEAPSGSGLFESRDGGRSWTSLDDKSAKGLPAKPWGRIGVEIAPSDPKIVYAVIEGVRSALFRSDDGGKTWEERDRSQSMVWRPFYFSRLEVDPKNAEKVFKHNLSLIVSLDGGKSFSGTGGGAHGDWHDLWINPNDTNHVIGGDDGGLWISYDGGNRWWKGNNLPISQFYHVSVDNKDPYQVYGGLQDNSSWAGDSSYPGGITNDRWENMFFGDGFWTFADPANPDRVYAEAQGGFVGWIDRKTRQIRLIQPQSNSAEKLRWNWNTPIHISATHKDTLYVGAQYVFRSRDAGQTWQKISPDLTTNDKQKQKQEESGGITVDNSAAEMHTTVYSISESPKNASVIWAGTDDGNLQVTRDGGGTWTNVVKNVKGLPKSSWVSWVEASRHDEGTAYATFDRHTFGDMDPHVYKTTDFGRSWTRIAGAEQGLRGYAHVVREDSVSPDILFVGTEFGLWITIDGGGSWAQFKGGNFPNVAVRDIALQARDNDLVLGTHGRGIWVIDDITPLRSLNAEVLQADAAFVAQRRGQQRISGFGGWAEGDASYAGENPPGGAIITYYQRTRHLFGDLKIEVLDADGKVIDTIPASKRRGLNRVSWAMRAKPPVVPPAASIAGFSTQGPRLLPGTYTVRMTKNKQVYETRLDIGLDRRASYTLDDRRAQLAAAQRVSGMFGQISGLMMRINAVREQAGMLLQKTADDARLAKQLGAFSTKADDIRKKIVATKEGGAITGEERIREHLDNLFGMVTFYEGRPGDYVLARADELQRQIDQVSKDFDALVANELPAVNKTLEGKQLPAIQVPPAMPVAESHLSSGDAGTMLGNAFRLPGHWAFPVRHGKVRAPK
jgi:photosystem II stability/assembly factor-like uncharacterized protein